MTREIPKDVVARRQQWQDLATRYYWIHNGLGITTTGLTALIAANTQGDFLPAWCATGVAVLIATGTFLMTAFNAKAKAERFELAGRELEKSIARYQYNNSLTDDYLGEAIAKGIDLMKLGKG